MVMLSSHSHKYALYVYSQTMTSYESSFWLRHKGNPNSCGNGHIFRHKAGSGITWTTSFSVLIKYLTCTTSSNHQLITLLLQSLDRGRTEFEKQKQYCFKIVRLIKLFNEITRSNEIKDPALVVDITTRTATCPVKITHYSNSKVEVELCRSQNTKEHVSVIGYHLYLLAVEIQLTNVKLHVLMQGALLKVWLCWFSANFPVFSPSIWRNSTNCHWGNAAMLGELYSTFHYLHHAPLNTRLW